ncbi:MAG: hypothetical protein AAF702_24820 [Chloroflexota bacterium]
MKKIFRDGLFFCAGLLVIHFALGFIFNNVILSQTGLAKKDKNLRLHNHLVDTLVLGDSHSLNNIAPTLLSDSTFNLAVGGLSYMQTYYRLKHYLENEDNGSLQVIILPYDLHSFSSNRANNIVERPYYWKKYIDYVEYGLQTNTLLRAIQIRIVGEIPYLSGFTDTVRFLKANYQRQVNEDILSSIRGDFSKSKNPEAQAAARAKEHFGGHDVLDSTAIYYFDRIMSIATTANLQVVLIKHPVSHEYYVAASRFVNTGEFYDRLATLTTSKYDVIVLDHQKTYFDQNDLFVNSDHLNVEGRRRFTYTIRDELSNKLGLFIDRWSIGY